VLNADPLCSRASASKHERSSRTARARGAVLRVTLMVALAYAAHLPRFPCGRGGSNRRRPRAWPLSVHSSPRSMSAPGRQAQFLLLRLRAADTP